MNYQLTVAQMHYYHVDMADGFGQNEAEIYFTYSVNHRKTGEVLTSGVTSSHSTYMGHGPYFPPPRNNNPPKSTNCNLPFWDARIAVVPCVVTLAAWEWDHGADAVTKSVGDWAQKIGNALAEGGGDGGSKRLVAAGGLLVIVGTVLSSLPDDYIGSFIFDYPTLQNMNKGLDVVRAEPIPSPAESDDLLHNSGFQMTKIHIKYA